MSELLVAIVTHNFMLGFGVGVAAVYALSATVTVMWVCTHAEGSEG